MNKKQNQKASYKKPPITEAVIELRFVESLNNTQLEKFALKHKTNFSVQKIEQVQFKLLNQEKESLKTETKQEVFCYKLICNKDTSNIVQVKHSAISVSRLAPYENWDNISSYFRKYYNEYTNKKFKKLNRIGVRYINRIDIPSLNFKIEDYFKIHPKFPKKEELGLAFFSLSFVSELGDNLQLTVNLSSTDSPILEHSSVIFDIDISQVKDLPSNNNKLFDVLNLIRERKDCYFESFLTAKCKKLFK
jgi:uncharacterized protein (TIGR04255 family)